MLKKMGIVTVLCLVLTAGAIALNVRYAHRMARVQIADHARVVASALWTYQNEHANDYLNLAAQSNDYEWIRIADEAGTVFLAVNGPALGVPDRLLDSLGLLPRHQLASPIHFNGRPIGHVTALWRCPSIHRTLYLLVCLILLLAGIWLFLRLLDAKATLEERVAQRTAELHEINRKLAESEARHRLLVETMPSMLVSVDGQGRVTHWNTAAGRVTGVTAEQARGQPLDRIMPLMRRELDQVRQAIRDGRVRSQSKVVRQGADGQVRYEDVTVYPLLGSDVEGAVIRVDDVTERVRIEEMMIQSEKMLSVGGLAAGMAHEINNPLGVILQASQNIVRRVSADLPANEKAAADCGTTVEAVRSYLSQREVMVFLEDIRTSGQRAAQIVTDMLSFSRKPEAGGSTTDLAVLLDRTVALAQSDYDLKKNQDFRKIAIVREYGDQVPPVICQSGKIQQVFLNILRNGAEAMAAAGQASPRFVLRVTGQGAMARVEIEDNGPGMDEAVRRRVFEPFFTTKPPGVGTGLGMSVSYFIITEDHGGTLAVVSSPGAGARFVIDLPVKG